MAKTAVKIDEKNIMVSWTDTVNDEEKPKNVPYNLDFLKDQKALIIAQREKEIAEIDMLLGMFENVGISTK